MQRDTALGKQGSGRARSSGWVPGEQPGCAQQRQLTAGQSPLQRQSQLYRGCAAAQNHQLLRAVAGLPCLPVTEQIGKGFGADDGKALVIVGRRWIHCTAVDG